MTPWQKYQQDLQREDFVHDAAQENAVRHLQRLYDDLTADKPAAKGWFDWTDKSRCQMYSLKEIKHKLPLDFIMGKFWWGAPNSSN